jgi:superfamily II RNA helicase
VAHLVPTTENPLDRFLEFVLERGLDLYPAQEEAVLELYSGKNVILNTPTGSGKSLVALALHYLALCEGRRSVYTCPIKALVNEKFLALCRDFGPEQVGMITGDASVNPDAPILCCTAEILAIDALRYGAKAPVGDVIMDEFHYYSDRDRGWAWQVPLLTMPQTRFLLMSATLGDTSRFERGLTELNGRETVVVKSAQRPVPLEFKYSEEPLHEVARRLAESGRAPVYLVNFTQRECAERAQDFLSIDFCSKDEKRRIAEELAGESFKSPYGKEFSRLIRHGLGIHHAGLLPRYRILVEKLAQKGLLKIILGTDTLGVGVNVPIRTVVFTKLCKFDGEKTSLLSVRDFKQISGRAGRKGFDDEGLVLAQAPEHVIENLKNEAKAGNDPKKLKKIVKKGPPPKGYIHWDKSTFEKLMNGEPEALTSRFQVTHAMLLNVLSRGKSDDVDCCRDMAGIIRSSHESESTKKRLRSRAFELFRALVDRKLVSFNPLRLNVDLQEDFSLNHALSLYIIDAIAALDPEHENYSLDVLTLVESIIENPDAILRKQVDRLKTEKLAELKMEGVDYDQRMEELDKIGHPKPNADFIYTTFNAFAEAHPWVTQDTIHPKSIAREMYENFQSFAEYIRDYDLQRSEGLLLRYLSEVYKTLLQNIPELAKNEELFAMTDYFHEMIRQTDSSLLEEWQRLRDPAFAPQNTHLAEDGPTPQGPVDITRRKKEFRVLIRNEIFRRIRLLAAGSPDRWPEAWQELAQELGWTMDALQARMAEHTVEHRRILTDQRARGPAHLQLIEESSELWRAEQVLVDIDGHNDWLACFEIDLARSRDEGRAVLRLSDLRSI